MQTEEKTPTILQNDFEMKVCKILGFTGYISQNEASRNQMIIEHLTNDELLLSGTVAFKHRENFNSDVLLVATKDSEINHLEIITLEMIKEIISTYSNNDILKKGRYFEEPILKKNKITFATNIPLELHSETASYLKKKFNFKAIKIGYSFCEENNLQYTGMY